MSLLKNLLHALSSTGYRTQTKHTIFNICIFEHLHLPIFRFLTSQGMNSIERTMFSQWKSWDKINILEQPPDPPRSYQPQLLLKVVNLGKVTIKNPVSSNHIWANNIIWPQEMFFFFPGILLDPTLSLRRPQALGVDTEKQDKMLSERKKSMFWGAPSRFSIRFSWGCWSGKVKGFALPKSSKSLG